MYLEEFNNNRYIVHFSNAETWKFFEVKVFTIYLWQ